MGNNSDKEKDYTTIKDSRGDIKMYSSPPRKTPVKTDIHEVVEKNKRSPGSMKFFYNFIKVIGCWLPTIFVIFAVIFIISKPPMLWNSFVEFVNNDLKVPSYNEITEAEALEQINTQLTTVGENIIPINESQLAAILKPRLQQLKDIKVDIEEGVIRLLWTLDESIEGKPIYGVIELVEDGNTLVIDSIGTGRFILPDALKQAISSSLLSISQIGNGANAENIMDTVLPFDENLEIRSMEIKQDLLELVVYLNANLFQ